MRERQKIQGSLMVEATIALGVLLLFMMVIMSTGTSALRASRNYETRSQANGLLNSAFYSLRAHAASDQSDVDIDLESEETLDGVSFQVQKNFETRSDGFQKLTATISWEGAGENRKVSRTLLLSPSQEP